MSTTPIPSTMAIKGHPIHPMLIHFPVAALIGLIATDLAYVYSADFFWARAGLWLAGIGAGGGWIASVVGFIDLVTVEGIRRLITSWCHAILAVMMLSLATLNWLLRFPAAELHVLPWGLALSGLTGLVIAITAYLGGRLVYEHAVGVDAE